MFRHSAASEIHPNRLVESWHRLPNDIYPAYIGSGILALGVDATGLQGAGLHIGAHQDSFSYDGVNWLEYNQPYLFRDKVLSRHHGWDHIMVGFEKEPAYANMPQGWFDYQVEIDGELWQTADLLENAEDWTREMEPGTGTVTTSMTLGPVRISWTLALAVDAEWIAMQFSWESLDGQSHQVKLETCFRHQLRSGKPVSREALEPVRESDTVWMQWTADSSTATADVYRPAELRYGWKLAGGEPVDYADHRLSVTVSYEGKQGTWNGLFFSGSDRENSLTQKAVSELPDPQEALSRAQQSWKDYFASAASVQMGDAEIEFLCVQTQHLLRAGGSWRDGLPLGTNFTQKFAARTFWDSFFAADGMLRCGHVQEVRDIAGWICRTMQPEGRPHCWMTYFDGVVPTNPKYDIAWHVVLAFSGICIRLYETTKSKEDLTERVYPYLARVAEFAFDELLDQDESGWFLKGTTAHDVGTEKLLARNELDLMMWLTVSVAKFSEYAEELDTDHSRREAAASLRRWAEENPIPVTGGAWKFWLPYMALPGPLMDQQAWLDAVGSSCVPGTPFIIPAQDKPWDSLSTGASLLELGQNETAWLQFQGARMGVVGVGYWLESSFEHQCGGFAPYIPSGGAFLSQLTMMFAKSSLWKEDLDICTGLPKRLLSQRLTWSGIRTPQGAVTSGTYAPDRLDVELTLDRRTEVTLRVPLRVAGGPLTLHVNKAETAEAELDSSGDWMRLTLSAGTYRLKLVADLTSASDVLLIEPAPHGRELLRVLGEESSIRLHPSYQGLETLIPLHQTVIFHMHSIRLPDEVLDVLEDWVHEGGRLITLFHAGLWMSHKRMGALTGVNGIISDWETEGFWKRHDQIDQRVCTMTPEGKQRFGDLPECFTWPFSWDPIPDPADDVEILAVDDRDRAVLTRRPLGKGEIYWIGTGDKMMGGQDARGWGGCVENCEVIATGARREDLADLQWLRDPVFQQLLRRLTC